MKNNILAIATSIVIALSAISGAARASSLKPSDKVALQAAMFQHIDSLLVEGAFLRFDGKSGTVQKLAPTKAHPMIIKMAEHFVLCSDFRDPSGKEVNIDFFMARSGAGYVVFHTEIDNRAPLEKLMESGKAVAAD